jgi:hypothetical protein
LRHIVPQKPRFSGFCESSVRPVRHCKLPAACRGFTDCLARRVRAGAAVLAFLLPALAFGTGEDRPPELRIQTFPDHALVGTPWFLTILVDYPFPDELEIRAPPFPDSLVLDTVRRDLRFIRWPADRGGRWTAVEYRFVPAREGTARVGPFEVRGPWGSLTAGPVTVEIWTEENRRRKTPGPVFSWRAPSVLGAGEAAFLDLLVIPGEYPLEEPLPDPALFVPAVPPGAILERELPDVPAGVFLRLRVVPLAPPLFSLPPYQVRQGRQNRDGHAFFEIPPLRIPVTAAGGDTQRPPGAGNRDAAMPEIVPALSAGERLPPPVSPEDAAVPERAPASPAFAFDRGRRIFPPLRGGYEGALKRAEGFLAAGDPVRALAELRRNERDSLAGPLFAAPRRELEQMTGLQDGGAEKWRPRALFGILLWGCPAAALLLVLLRLKNRVTFSPSWGYKSVMFMLIAGALAGSVGMFRFSGRRSAVLRECAARGVPDSRALESFRFAGGSRARVRTVEGTWAWVEAGETGEGAEGAGWVPLKGVVFF